MTVIAVAGAGVVINGFTAWLFTSGHGADLNVRGAYLHMIADAAVSAGVVAAGIVIIWTGALWIDPVVSLVIAVVILRSTWDLLRESVAMSLAGVPRGIDVKGVRDFLASLDGVTRVHHLHIWPISTTETALTGHLVMPGGHPGDGYLKQVAHELEHRFGIRHTTMQIELGRGEPAEAGTDRVA
jgi:cobalt-zinc-cadmium efflux system protein